MEFSNDVCNSLEKNYFDDNDIKEILSSGVTPHSLLAATRLIKEKENSPLIKLNLDFVSDNVDSIETLSEIVDIACLSGTMGITLECIENAKTQAIMLKVQAPFSALMVLVGSNRMFKWICKYPDKMHDALNKLTNSTYEFCLEAMARGTSIISLADPSGILELLGEKKYKEFCAFYIIKLMKMLSPYLENSLIHLCPRASIVLEKLGVLELESFSYERKNYADAVLELSKHASIKIMGHRCINAELTGNSQAYILTPNFSDVLVREMKPEDWQYISHIYNEGIRSHNATILKDLPDYEQWQEDHAVCFVAEFCGNIMGFVALTGEVNPKISVYVKQEFWGCGIGTKLIEELKDNGQTHLTSLIFEKNTRSIKLHEKCGFKNTGSYQFENDSRKVLIYEWSLKND